MKTVKRQLHCFSFYDITGMETHLEAMAQQGWMLEKLGSFLWTYRRCAPKTVHFAVTYYPPASAFEPEPSEGQQTFTDFCDHAGWHLVGSNAQMLIFANEREDPVPIHTDPEPEIESLERMAKRLIWIWVLLLALGAFHLWVLIGQLLHDPIGLLSSPMQIVSGLCMAIFALYSALELCTWFRWRKRARAAAANGEFLPTHGHQRFFRLGMLLFLLGMVYILLADQQPGFRQLLLVMLAGYVGLFAAVNGVRTLLKKKKVSTNYNRFITLTVDVVLAVVLCGGILRFSFHTVGTIKSAPFEMAVTIEDLTGREDLEESIQERTFSSASFLVSKIGYYQHPHYDQPQKNISTLGYTQLDVHFAPLYSLCLRQMLHQYDHFGDSHSDDVVSPVYLYQETDPVLWGCDTAYQLYHDGEADTSYLLCWAERIVELEPSWLLTEEQMAIVGAAFAP